jgi:hypothetical protein
MNEREKMNEPKAPNISQAGRIIIEGKLALQFWVRALGLEADIKHAQELILEKAQRKWGTVPIISEYQIDPRLKLVFILIANVDALGLQNGTGVIYYASPDQLEHVYRARDAAADDILKGLESSGFDETVRGRETIVEVIEEGDERTRL